MQSAIRAVVFDLGNTLWFDAAPRPAEELHGIIGETVRALLAAWGKLPQDSLADVVADLVAAEDEALRIGQERGTFVEPSVAYMWRGALAVRGIEISEAEAIQLWKTAWIPVREFGIQLYPDSLDVLATVRAQGLRIGIATNRPCTADMLWPDLHDYGLAPFIDFAVCSGDTGFTKPHPSTFEAVLAGLGTSAVETVMVGDGAADVVGGKAVGMRTVQKLNGRYGAEPNPGADFAIHDLGELLRLPLLTSGASVEPPESLTPHDDGNEDRY